jgi:hypothetical protein
MEKDLNILQKSINLHVNDIKRIQGAVSNLAIKKGQTSDELRRKKIMAKRTQEQINRSKAAVTENNTDASKTQTVSGGLSKTQNTAFVEGSPVDVLLFGFSKKNSLVTSLTYAQTGSSQETSGSPHGHVVGALRFLLKRIQYTSFSIATIGPDGQRLYSKDAIKNAGGFANMKKETLL